MGLLRRLVPISTDGQPRPDRDPVPAGRRPSLVVSEQFDGEYPEFLQLFYAVEALRTGQDSLVVQFAGVDGGEGVTTVASGFARVAAREYDGPLLYLDCRPASHGSAADRTGRKPRTNPPPEQDESNLKVLPLPDGPAPGGRNAQEDIRMHVDSFRIQYRLVILDSPPVGKFPRAAALSSVCDGTVLVVQAERTSTRALQAARENVERLGGQVVGLVFNRARQRLPAWLARRL